MSDLKSVMPWEIQVAKHSFFFVVVVGAVVFWTFEMFILSLRSTAKMYRVFWDDG